MALITIDGIYENGKVELAEPPKGVRRARVRVTFLPDATANQPKHAGPVRAAQSVGAPVSDGRERYPQAIRDEYALLIHKKLHGTTTSADDQRLDEVRAEINQIDSQSARCSAREQGAAEIDAAITALRQELEALPDA